MKKYLSLFIVTLVLSGVGFSFSPSKALAWSANFSASDGQGGFTVVDMNGSSATAPTLTTTATKISLYVEGTDPVPNDWEGVVVVKGSSPTVSGWSGTVPFCHSACLTFKNNISLPPGNYTFYARTEFTSYQGTDQNRAFLYGVIPVTILQPVITPPTTASMAVNNSCPIGSGLMSPDGVPLAPGQTQTWTEYPSSSGTTYTPSFTANGYTVSISPSSQIVYPGDSASFNITCSPNSPKSIAVTLSASANPYSCSTGTTLTWNSENTTSCSAPWTNSTAVSGSQSVTPNGTTLYSITCSGAGGSSDTKSVTVNAPVPACAGSSGPSCTVTANPTTVSAGGNTTVALSSSRIVSCSPVWWLGGSTGTSGSQIQNPYSTTNYSASCTGDDSQTYNCSATVDVPVSGPTPVVTISADPSSGIKDTINPTINWSVANNPTSCTASGDWSGTKAASGSQSMGVLTTAKTYTYTLTCLNANGQGQASAATVVVAAQSHAIINVSSNSAQGSWTISPENISGSGTDGSYTVNPSKNGQTYIISAGAVNGSYPSVTNSDGGSTSMVVSPTETKSFTLVYPSFNYSLSNSGATTIEKGQTSTSGTNRITETLTSGASQPVNLTVSGAPVGVSTSASTCSPMNPTCTSTVTLTVDPSTVAGQYTITVTGNPLGKTTSFTLNVQNYTGIIVSCSASPTTALVGQNVTWTASASGGDGGPYNYTWTGTNVPTGPAPTGSTLVMKYSTIGQKVIDAYVTDGHSNSGSCSGTPNGGGTGGLIQLNFNPTFKEF